MPKTWPETMTPQERIARARVLISKQIDDLRELLAISESNRLIIYSPTLASQIPRSYAANAFNLFQACSLNYEILRASALWDAPAEDRASIPTLVALVNDPSCRTLVEADLGNETYYKNYRQSQMRRFDRAVEVAQKVRVSKLKKTLYDFRNRDLAHNLVFDQKNAPAVLPKYGYERRLLRASIAIVSNFNNSVRDSSFMFDMAIEQRRRNACALWGACTFNIAE